MKKPGNARELIIKTLKSKAVMKMQIYQQSKEVFKIFKENLLELNNEMTQLVNSDGTRLNFSYHEKSDYEASISFAGDTLIFHLHSNVFGFDKSHYMYNTPYIKMDEDRAYCSVINIYNFLTDSFKYKRDNDIGYLIARIFVNKEKHFFVEGKRQLGFLYNEFGTTTIDKASAMSVIESAVLYAINFDLLTPNYEQVKQVSIGEIYSHSEMLQQITGKRMGFTFKADSMD